MISKYFRDIINSTELFRYSFLQNYYMWVNNIKEKRPFYPNEIKLLHRLWFNFVGYSPKNDEGIHVNYQIIDSNHFNSSKLYISTCKKYIKKEYTELSESFISEVYMYTLLSRCNLSYISPKLINIGIDKNYYHYLIFEYIEDYDKNELLSIDNIIDLLTKINELHKIGISHNDIKPGNFILSKENKIKIIDYEFCNVSFPFYKYDYNIKIHMTPLYASVEKLHAKEIDKYKYTHADDIWSLGIIILEKYLNNFKESICMSDLKKYAKNLTDVNFLKTMTKDITLLEHLFIKRSNIDNIIKILVSQECPNIP